MADKAGGKSGAGAVGEKRKRVRIAEERNETVAASADAGAAPSAGDGGDVTAHSRLSASEAAARRAAARIANAEQLAKLEADDRDAAGEDVVVGGGADDGDDSDDGLEPEAAAGGDDDFGDKGAVRDKLRSAGAAGGAGDAEADRKGGAKKLMRVRGELRDDGLAEEFNEAGDAFEPFHLRGEREDGYFDAGGNFVWKKRGGGDEDAWLAGLDAMDPRERAVLQKRAATNQRGEERAARAAAGGSSGSGSAQKRARTGAGGEGLVGLQESKTRESDAGSDSGSGSDNDDDDDDAAGEGLQPRQRLRMLLTLRELMRDGETVAAALRRLSGRDTTGAAAAKRKGGASSAAAAANSASSASAADAAGSAAAGSGSGSSSSSSSTRDMASFYKLTEAADALLSGGGEPGVYSWRPVDVVDKLDDVCEELGMDPREVLRGSANGAAAAAAGGSAAAAAGLAETAGASGVVAGSAPLSATDAAAAAVPMPPDDGRQWRFKWSDNNDDAAAEIHGPYSTAVLRAWKAGGMYGPERPIFVQEVVAPAAGAGAGAGAGAPAAASATKSVASAAALDEDGDDDIFAGAGGYDVKAAASAAAAAARAAAASATWLRYDAAGF